MNGFLVVPLLLVTVSPRRGELPPESLRLKEPTPAKAIDRALKKLSLPCPDRIHQNDFFAGEDLSRFRDNVLLQYRPRDLYEDCADEMDALVRSREAIDGRLLQLADKGRTSPERYRAAWVLIQRRNRRVVPILDKMAASSSAEERYLCWHAYRWAIRERQLDVPKSCEAAMAHCRKEKNPYVQAEIMNFLGACKAKEAVPLLIAGLNNDPEYGAVQALGEIRDPRAVPAILERARKEELNPDIYYRALGQIGTREAVDYLLEHLDEDSSAVEALFGSGSPRALPAIEKHLAHLKKQKQPDDLHLAVAQISVFRLKYKDPRERLIVLAEDPKQSRWMRTHALEALGYYDKKPFSSRILKLYRTEADDGIRMFCIRLLRDLPGDDITEAMIHYALADNKEEYSDYDYDLVQALNQRLNTSYRTLPPLVEHLKRERAAKKE